MIIRIGVPDDSAHEAQRLEQWFAEQGSSANWHLIAVWGGPDYPSGAASARFSFPVTSIEISRGIQYEQVMAGVEATVEKDRTHCICGHYRGGHVDGWAKCLGKDCPCQAASKAPPEFPEEAQAS